ncbi:patatin-like phospholipase family protein [Burkholderia sp. R-69608]|uniref:patatin-like phospholipase family protein n=1 Tax=Paraburkholderia nemoris TaxID=2793076 RepID=UPI0019138F92|nr:patatin-like phospholipase family protein [Paraburkholderia nemoris]MBK5149201.1 patatin-like phospholipase family protein [Burkholderia sp. R-69608]
MSRALASEQLQQTAAHMRRRPIVLRFRCTVALLACGVATFARPALAAESACSAQAGPAGRPSVGLVLSGGGARGYAHLGVLKVLEENRIPVDCIAATSMGSVVGGLYASGMTAQDMQNRLAGINLADIAFDVTDRADLPQSRREDERLYVNSLSLGFGTNGFRLPVGLVQGNRLQALLQDWTSAVPGNVSFDRLPIPYRAIATDLRTGQKVVLDRGSLPQAIRASMALPGLFAPADIDGRTLVDGGIVSNLPIETARDMGANVVIAVDIGSPLRPLDALASPADVMQQMIGILIHQNVARQREQLQAGDVLIEPALGSLSFTDFANASQAIAAGAAATRAAMPQLQHLALSPADYAAWRARHGTPAIHPVRITQIEIASQGYVPEARIRAALHVKTGDVYDPVALNKDLLALTTAGDFDSVSQQLVDDGDAHTLIVSAQQKLWGPNFLLFGLGLSSSSTDEGGFRLHLGYRRPWLTSSGLEGRVDGTVGSDLINLHAELRQPLSSTFGYYVAPYLEFQRRYANLYDDSGNVKVTQYSLQTERAGLDFGVPLARFGDFRIGVAYAHGYASPQYNLPLEDELNSPLLFPDIYGRQLSARARLVIDQLDDPLFARKGYFGELRVERSLFAGSDSFTEVYGKSLVAASYGRHSINASIEAGNDFGGTNLTNPFGFTLGGFQHLSAYAADQLSGNSMVYGQITYMNQLATFNASPIRGLFAGLSIEAGNVWNRDSEFGSGPLKRSVTVFTAMTSSFGPIYLGVAFAPGGRHNFYFQLGHTY